MPSGPTGHGFTHLDEHGAARMVDVTPKESTKRVGIARARVVMSSGTAAAIQQGVVGKGDVLAVARVAGIQGAKRTSELIPLCHPIMIGSAEVNFEIGESWVDVEARVETVGPTGVEMEALTACSVAALTIYDMCKARDRGMTVESLGLWHKSGGRSGDWQRQT
ncbi:MAG: cyclic pyranopterin monophosphate synthase MoaC [Acidimicrobiales bacterium]|jgi:cyclic pyranopterin phosphate synthase